MKSIPFFSGEMRLAVHSATLAAHVGKHVSIDSFANGSPVRLSETEDGEYLCEKADGSFINGPEVKKSKTH